ncbi:MAG: InlB B-repeat-containing protein [Coriobacteriales bacterium]|jgi:hypothetical protein|nr:InlB B-repeat-containing protein [Coriobacteriales bacterium]
MDWIKKKLIALTATVLFLALALPALPLALADEPQQSGLVPLAPGDVPIDASTFPDPDFRYWIGEQDWGEDGVLTSAEAEAVTHVNVDLVGVCDLTGIEYFPNLWYLSCSDNYITEIDTSYNPELMLLYAEGNPELSSVDVTGNPLLESLDCSGGKLTSIDVSGNPKLGNLSVNNNELTELDLPHNLELYSISCYGNELTELDVSHNPELIEISCDFNHLTTLDLSHNLELDSLWVVTYSDQTSSATVYPANDSTGRYVDLAEVVGQENLKNVTSVFGGSFSPETGLVVLDDATTDTITYTYDVGYRFSSYDMNVTLALTSGTPETLQASFDAGDGTVITATVARGSRLVRPEDPKKDGYRFLGWAYGFTEQGNTVFWDFDDPVLSSLSLTAQWEKIPDQGTGDKGDKPVVTGTPPGTSLQPVAANQDKAQPSSAIPATGHSDTLLAVLILAFLSAAPVVLLAGLRMRGRKA